MRAQVSAWACSEQDGWDIGVNTIWGAPSQRREAAYSSCFFSPPLGLPHEHWYGPAARTWAGKLSTCSTSRGRKGACVLFLWQCLPLAAAAKAVLLVSGVGISWIRADFLNHPKLSGSVTKHLNAAGFGGPSSIGSDPVLGKLMLVSWRQTGQCQQC
jgi:hypothetical protein